MTGVKANSIMRLTILVLLYDSPYCGYELIKSVKRITGANTSSGSVLPFIEELKKYNYLTSDSDTETLRSKKSYSLTKEGKIFAKNSLSVVKQISDQFMDKCEDCGPEFFGTVK